MIPFELLSSYLNLPTFLLVVSRIGGIVMFLPMLGGASVPMQIRALLILGLGFVIAPVVSLGTTVPSDPGALTFGLAGEFAIGVVIGIALRMCFVGLQIGAQLIAQESGTAFAQIVDPNVGSESDMLGVFYTQLAGVVFLILGGHRALVGGTLDSFKKVPLLQGRFDPGQSSDLIVSSMTAGCELGLRVAAPVLVTLLVVNVALGFLARTFPQLNVITVGFSIKGVLAFVLVAVTLPAGMDVFLSVLETTVKTVMSWTWV